MMTRRIRRYVDDTLVRMPDLTAGTAFLDTLNHAHSAASFTFEVEEKVEAGSKSRAMCQNKGLC